ncbi:hypothetical protein [Modestobacter lapidis]|nr:hypothetical protein [Modestobacter lapidis]
MKVWKIVARDEVQAVAEFIVAAETKAMARAAFLAMGLRGAWEPPATVKPVQEALDRPGVVLRRDWQEGTWTVV